MFCTVHRIFEYMDITCDVVIVDSVCDVTRYVWQRPHTADVITQPARAGSMANNMIAGGLSLEIAVLFVDKKHSYLLSHDGYMLMISWPGATAYYAPFLNTKYIK